MSQWVSSFLGDLKSTAKRRDSAQTVMVSSSTVFSKKRLSLDLHHCQVTFTTLSCGQSLSMVRGLHSFSVVTSASRELALCHSATCFLFVSNNNVHHHP